MEASLCRHDWLNHWPLVINATSSPLITRSVERGLFWMTKDIPLTSTAQEITRVLGALWQEPGTKTKYPFLIISQWACVGVRVCACVQGKVGRMPKCSSEPRPVRGAQQPRAWENLGRFKNTFIQPIEVPVPDTGLSTAGRDTLTWTRIRADELLWSKPTLNLFRTPGDRAHRWSFQPSVLSCSPACS